MCFNCLYKESKVFLILIGIQRYTIISIHRYLLKVSLFLVTFYLNLNFLDRFSKNFSIIKFHENPSGGSRVVSSGRTYMTKLTVAFRNVANAPKNVTSLAQNISITDDSKSLHCILHFHDIFICDFLSRFPNFFFRSYT